MYVYIHTFEMCVEGHPPDQLAEAAQAIRVAVDTMMRYARMNDTCLPHREACQSITDTACACNGVCVFVCVCVCVCICMLCVCARDGRDACQSITDTACACICVCACTQKGLYTGTCV